MKVIHAIIASIRKAPGKTGMTLLAVGLGVGVLISSLNISGMFSYFMDRELAENGLVLTVANAEYSEEGGLERIRPAEFDERVMDIIRAELPGVSAISPATLPFFELQVTTGGDSYRIRSLLGVNEEYPDIMGLNIVNGRAFTGEEVEAGEKTAVISDEAAKTLFGSAETALGKIVRPPQLDATQNTGSQSGESQPGGSRSGGADNGESEKFMRRMVPPSYEIIGVFEAPSELKRKAYGIGDVLVPYPALLPAEMNSQLGRGFLLSTLTFAVSGSSRAATESRLRNILSREYGEDITVHVWEGTPRGGESVLEEARQSLGTMTVVINLLGFILLITGSFGILSIMIVEVTGRSREIAMKRALGADRGVLIREFWLRALILSLMSAAVGFLISLLFLDPLRTVIIPIFSDIKMSELTISLFRPASVVIGVGSALLFGGFFGILPLFSALKTPIAEGIREV